MSLTKKPEPVAIILNLSSSGFSETLLEFSLLSFFISFELYFEETQCINITAIDSSSFSILIAAIDIAVGQISLKTYHVDWELELRSRIDFY